MCHESEKIYILSLAIYIFISILALLLKQFFTAFIAKPEFDTLKDQVHYWQNKTLFFLTEYALNDKGTNLP